MLSHGAKVLVHGCSPLQLATSHASVSFFVCVLYRNLRCERLVIDTFIA